MAAKLEKTPLSPEQKERQLKIGKRIWIGIFIVGAFFVGIGIGNSGTSSAEADTASAAPTPAPTVTATVTESAKPLPAVTETVAAELPAVCSSALDRADAMQATAAEGFGVAGRAMGAATSFDVEGLSEANDDLSDMVGKTQRAVDAYTSARDECRIATS